MGLKICDFLSPVLVNLLKPSKYLSLMPDETFETKERRQLGSVGEAHYETAMFYRRMERHSEAIRWFHSAFQYGSDGLRRKLVRETLEEDVPLCLTSCFREVRGCSKLLLDEAWRRHSIDGIFTVTEDFWWGYMANEWKDVLSDTGKLRTSHRVPHMQPLTLPSARLTEHVLQLYTDPHPDRVPRYQFSPYAYPSYEILFNQHHYGWFSKKYRGEVDRFPDLKESEIIDPRKISVRFREVYDELSKQNTSE